MTLYKMELYRITHRKLLWFTAAILLFWHGFFCWCNIADEISYVDGTYYTGVAAIREDREITEAYTGALTDRMADGIVAQYGYPTQVKEGIGWLDANYLTRFVTTYLSDGHLQDWEAYTLATRTTPIQESWLANYQESDGTLTFGYVRGYQKLIDFVELGAYFASVFLMIALAPLFCEDRQNEMRALIFTTEHGRCQDVHARILAAMTVAVATCAVLVLPVVLVCGILYGFSGGGMRTGVVLDSMPYFGLSYYPIAVFTALYLMTVCGALFMLAACSVLISAVVKSTFYSVLAAMILWGGPVILFLTFRNRWIYFITSMLPFTLVNRSSLIETYHVYGLHVSVMLAVIIGGSLYAGRHWRRVDRE